MKPLDSEQDKLVTVRAFVNARYNKLVKITSYDPMVTYLNGEHIEVLYEKLPKSAQTKQYNKECTIYHMVDVYNANDAKMYLEWLISVVYRSEKASEEIFNKAVDQLCKLILVLTDVTEWTNEEIVIAKPYDWVQRLEKFEEEISEEIKDEIEKIKTTLDGYEYHISGYDNKLDELCKELDSRTQKMIDPIEQILTWMQKYSPTLDLMQKEYAGIFKNKRQGKKNVRPLN